MYCVLNVGISLAKLTSPISMLYKMLRGVTSDKLSVPIREEVSRHPLKGAERERKRESYYNKQWKRRGKIPCSPEP